MKYFAIAALLGLVSYQQVEATQITRRYANVYPQYLQESSDSESDTDSDSSEEENIMMRGDDEEKEKEEPYPHWMDGFGGYHTYVRDIPDRFEGSGDDTLMKSLYKNYATEGKANGLPNGHFWVTREDAQRAATEVAANNLGLGAKANSYVKSNFDELWGRYDVNEEGQIDIDRMPQFLRTFCGNNEQCLGLQ